MDQTQQVNYFFLFLHDLDLRRTSFLRFEWNFARVCEYETARACCCDTHRPFFHSRIFLRIWRVRYCFSFFIERFIYNLIRINFVQFIYIYLVYMKVNREI